MAQQVLELHPPISLYFIKYPKHLGLQLSSSEWQELKEVCACLQVFASATTVLSSETDPTAAFMCPSSIASAMQTWLFLLLRLLLQPISILTAYLQPSTSLKSMS